MIVRQIWTGNLFRNFNYLVVCPETREALAIDPLDHRKCLAMAQDNGWRITQILNTHHHLDHIGGNRRMVAATGAQLLAHAGATGKIRHVDRGLAAGDTVHVGRSVVLQVLDTPGHTLSHVCLLARSGEPALFSGDTLFNAGAGNCKAGGDPARLYDTLSRQLGTLPEHTRLYPGHDYLRNNLHFTLSLEPSNRVARALLKEHERVSRRSPFTSTLAVEKAINLFLRLDSGSVVASLRQRFPELGQNPPPEAVFLKLRALRDHWSRPWRDRAAEWAGRRRNDHP